MVQPPDVTVYSFCKLLKIRGKSLGFQPQRNQNPVPSLRLVCGEKRWAKPEGWLFANPPRSAPRKPASARVFLPDRCRI